jgi:GT2 family glycosyltransferase
MKKSNTEISFVIVNYNSIELLLNLLESIRKTTGVVSQEIIIIDNNSEDNSVEIIQSKYPEILLIQNHKNMGFGFACNQGIKVSRGAYVLLLNSDTELFPDTIANVQKHILTDDVNENTGIYGFKLLNPDGTLQYSMGRFPTICSTILDMFKPASKRKVYTRGYDKIRQVDWVTGACMFIDRKIFGNIGLFDENYFMYYEETDFCFRAKRAGWKVLFHPGISVIHKHPHARKKSKVPLKIKIEIRRSHLYFFRKNRNYISFVLLFAATMFILYLEIIIKKLLSRSDTNDHYKIIQAVKNQFFLLNTDKWKTQQI